MTEFQRQLNNISKTKEQVNDAAWENEKKNIEEKCDFEYYVVKQQITYKANNAQYTTNGNTKQITYVKGNEYLKKCIDNNFHSDIKRPLFGSMKTINHYNFVIRKEREYHYYIDYLRKLASEDGVTIDVETKLRDIVYNKSRLVTLPYSCSELYTHYAVDVDIIYRITF